MSKLADVKDAFSQVYKQILFIGAEDHVIENLNQLFRDIGKAIMEERHISSDLAADLPNHIELGEKSEKAFKKFCDYVKKVS